MVSGEYKNTIFPRKHDEFKDSLKNLLIYFDFQVDNRNRFRGLKGYWKHTRWVDQWRSYFSENFQLLFVREGNLIGDDLKWTNNITSQSHALC